MEGWIVELSNGFLVRIKMYCTEPFDVGFFKTYEEAIKTLRKYLPTTS